MKIIGLAMVVGLVACGGGDKLSDFVGTWTPAPGAALTGTCSDGSQLNTMLTTADVFAKGVDADLTSTSDGCIIRFDVDGGKATARSGQSCTTMQSGVTLMLTIQQYTLTLGSDSKTITSAEMGTIQLSGSVTGTCTVGATYMLNKVAN
jgi:hypothetical protein